MVKRRRRLTKVVDQGEEASTKEEREEHGKEGIPVLEQAGRQSSPILLPELDTNEDCNHQPETNEEANDLRVIPGVFGTAPLEGEEETDNTRDEDGSAGEIELFDAFEECHVLGIGRVAVDMEEEEDDNHSQAADGKTKRT